jgi:GWxTD domain-containing protein
MEVPEFGVQSPELSTIEFAYEIEPDTAGRFVKNGVRVMPNPSHNYSRDTGQGHFYAEGYGLDTTSMGDSVFMIAIDIVNANGEVAKKLPTLAYQKPGESAVISASFPVDSLVAGKYGLRVSLVDGEGTSSRLNSFSVSVPREHARATMLQGIMKEFPEAVNATSEEDAQKFKDEIRYIAGSDEMHLFESLPLEGKSTFQKDFWARRDPDPSTPQNEYQIEHYKRFKYANSNFGRFQGGNPGWRSDRGRIFIIYGEPSEIERYAPTPEARAWERWWYHGLEGGVYFIFVDYETAGDYTLLHSSRDDERRGPINLIAPGD